jgi:hypothetical protein
VSATFPPSTIAAVMFDIGVNDISALSALTTIASAWNISLSAR